MVPLDRFAGTNGIVNIELCEEADMNNPLLHRTGRILTVLILSGCVFGVSIVRADGTDPFWEDSLHSAQRCQGAMNQGMDSGAECILGDGINILFDKGIGLADERIKETFGENYSISGRMTWSPDVGSTGELDMVTPFSFAGGDLEHPHSAFFLQQGVTRWRDGFGVMRNDLRHGVVHRIRVEDKPDSDVVGVSSFYLHSAEHGHKVIAFGLDYFGRWGTGEFRYFSPTTDWKAVRPGHEERPLGGMTLGTRLSLTSTIDTSITGYQWEAEDGSGDQNRGARLGLNWQPHPWLTFDTTWDRGNNDDSIVAGMRLSIPLGPRTEEPRWEGFGVAGGGTFGNAGLYQAVPEIGHIRVASRSAPIPASSSQDVTARFVEPSVGSGESVDVEVRVAEPTQSDITVIVRLGPGDGVPAAVAGEDFVDEPVETIIRQGTVSTVISIPLIRNDGMQEPRSLGVTASIAS